MIGKYLVNEQYILETSHWLITSRNEHKMTVNFINPGSAVEVKPDGILVWPLGSNQMESWFGRWGSERVKLTINIFSKTYKKISGVKFFVFPQYSFSYRESCRFFEN